MTEVAYRVGRTLIEIGTDLLFTVLPDGALVPAAPQDTTEYRMTAAGLGYEDDILRMCREHEVAHSLLCWLLGLPESPTMRGVAHGAAPTPQTNLEEAAVLAFQAFARALDIDLLALLDRRRYLPDG